MNTWRESILRWMLKALWPIACFVFLATIDIWIANSPFARWLESHNPLVPIWALITSSTEIPTLLLVMLWCWFVLTFALFVYVWRNFDFDDRKKQRPSISDVIRYQEDLRRRLEEGRDIKK